MTAAEVALAPGGSPRFVGRTRELAWLRDLLAKAGAGEARLGLVGGEPGVGKSSLVRELLSEADVAGWQTVWGRCSEDATVPHLPFATGLIPQLQRAGILEPAEAGATSALQDADLPTLASRLSDHTVTLAKRRRLVFVIDDLQAAEPGTLSLVRDYVRNISEVARRESLCVLLLVTHHPPLPGDAFASTLDRLRAEPLTAALELSGLSDPEVYEFVRQSTTANCDPHLLETLLSATGGNPFFLGEVLRDLDHRRLLVRAGDQVTTRTALGELRLAANAPISVARRLKSMPTELLSPLQTAAVLGDEFDLSELSAFHGEAEIEATVEHAASKGLLVETTAGFAFSHGIVRAAIVESLGPIRRRKLNAQIADVLFDRYGPVSRCSLRIARHVAAAGGWSDEAQTGAAYERAGDFALRSFGWGTAQHFLEAALALPGYVTSLDAEQLGWLYANAARANSNSGDIPASRRQFREAMNQLRGAGDLEGWGLALLGWWRSYSVVGEAVPEDSAYDEFSAVAGDRTPLVSAQLLAQRAQMLWFTRNEEDERVSLEALEAAERSGDPSTIAYAASVAGLIETRHLRPAAAIARFTEGLHASEPVPNPRVHGWSAARLSMPMILSGDLRGAREACLRAQEIARAGNDWQSGAMNSGVFHILATLSGDAALARTSRVEGITFIRRAMYPQAAFLLEAAVGWERLYRGELAEAIDAVNSWERAAGRSITRPVRLLLRAHAGEIEECRKELATFPLGNPSQVDYSNIGGIACSAELAATLHDPELASAMLSHLLPVIETGVVFSTAPPILLSRVAAAAARTAGEYGVAAAQLDIARHAAAIAGATAEAGLVALERARLLRETRGPASEFAAAVAEAAETFRRLDMVWASASLRSFLETVDGGGKLPALLPTDDELSATELEVLQEFARDSDVTHISERLLVNPRTVESHLTRLARRLGIQSPKDATAFLSAREKARQPQPAGKQGRLAELTPRELEVLELVARGYSNQQIADELVLSLHTAIRHVANILGKTGAANRTEAARLASATSA